MNFSKNKYKDDLPENTINKIRSIFNSLGIFTYENNWTKINDYCYSVRVEVDGLPGVGMNGKGTSRSFALASAYGELIERLQNRTLISKKYGLLYSDKFSFPDEIEINFKDWSETKKNVLSHLLDGLNEENQKYFEEYKSFSICAPFYNVNKSNVEYLPARLISLSCGTNGMCSGNTAEEAILHGICEIVERYVQREILMKELVLPCIPTSNIKSQINLQTINMILKRGYNVTVKDCTMGGRYPVLGLLITNKAKSKYYFKIGSDLDFEICIERCLTEMFQNSTLTELESKMLDVEWKNNGSSKSKIIELEKITKNGTGQFPNSILLNPDADGHFENAFVKNIENNKNALNSFLNRLINDKHDIYIRDLSFTGYPSYKIYIPGMSEVFILNSESLENNIVLAKAANTIMNLPEANEKELMNLIDEIEFSLKKKKWRSVGDSPIMKKTGIVLKDNAQFKNIDINFLSVLIYLALGNYENAMMSLNEYLKMINLNEYSNSEYFMCTLACLKYKLLKYTAEEIKITVEKIYNKSLVEEVMHDIFTRGSQFNHLSIPICKNCSNCRINEVCCVEKWAEITETFSEIMANTPISQDRLESILSYNLS